MDESNVMEMIRQIKSSVGSAYYASASLIKILENQKLSGPSFEALVNATGEIGSANYAAEVLTKAADKDLSDAQLISALKASGHIDSDHYLATVLQALADHVKSADGIVKEAYRQAAKQIDSETYYGRALKAIE
jgi:hypothetical protein